MNNNRTQFNKNRIDGLSLRVNELQNMTKGISLNDNIPVCIKLNCVNYSELKDSLVKPYDVRFNKAMIKAMNYVLEKTDAKIGYTFQGEVYLTYFKWSETEQSPIGTDTQMITAKVISMFSAKLNVELMKLIPDNELIVHLESRVWNVPSLLDAAELYTCQQTQCFKEAIDDTVKYIAPSVSNTSMTLMQKLKLLKENDVSPSQLPEFFTTGTFAMKTYVEDLVKAGDPMFGKQDIVLTERVLNYYIQDLSKDMNIIDEVLFNPVFNERHFFEKRNQEIASKK